MGDRRRYAKDTFDYFQLTWRRNYSCDGDQLCDTHVIRASDANPLGIAFTCWLRDEGRDMVPAKGLNARKRAMMSGLHSLRKTTGADFGYDAAAWRQFLIENGEEYGYMHP